MNKTQQGAEFSKAVAFLQRGQFAAAVSVFEAILRADPKNIGAGNLLGVALMRMGKLPEAAAALEDVLLVEPHQPTTCYNLGTIFQLLDRHDDAVERFRQAIALKPDDAQAHNNLAVTLKKAGRLEEASEAYRRAIAIQPDFEQAYSNLAAVLYALDRFDEAIDAAERALRSNPNSVEAYVCKGNALHAIGKTLNALEAFDRAIALQPDRPEAYLLAANALATIDRDEDSLPLLRRAAELDNSSASVRFQLAGCLHLLKRREESAEQAREAIARSKGRIEDEIGAGKYLMTIGETVGAIDHFRRALDIDPNSIAALEGYASSLNFMPNSKETVPLFDQILARKPQQATAMLNKAVASLAGGRFSTENWKLLDARLTIEGKITGRSYLVPRWTGEKLEGTLLVWGEQGIGDQILYASMIEEVAERVDRLVIEANPKLVPLFARSFPFAEVRALTKELNESDIDAHIAFGGLCEFFRHSWEDFRCRPYLYADKEKTNTLRGLISGGRKCTIGLSWRSANPKFGGYKTAKLSDFAPLFKHPEFAFFDFQYDETAEELNSVRSELGYNVRHLDEIDNTNDIDGLAALIEACDAVLTISNTTAHIAGALGKRVWIMIPSGPGRHWYWFRERIESPWYPEARIVRQQPGQSWQDLVDSITPEIVAYAKERRGQE